MPKKPSSRKTATVAMLVAAVTAAMALVVSATPKNNDKDSLPDYVLKAETVTVLILPDTPEPLSDPFANRKAQEEVEKAIMRWGRFQLTQDASTADLVIGVKKGTGKPVSPTISGGPVDSRPATIETTDNHIRIGVQQGRPPDGTQPTDTGGRTSPGMETSSITQDMFEVFRGGEQYRANNAPVWTYVAKDGLKPPAVSAVEKFRKVLEDAEKAARQKQQQRAQQQSQKKNP